LAKLTPKQREAIRLLDRCADCDDGWGVVTSGSTAAYDGQAWIHWRTARSLDNRGLVESTGFGEAMQLRLTEEGMRHVA
jgi:hypothetical protein